MKNLSSLFKRDNPNCHIFNILTPPLEEEVDSKNTFFEDGGVQGTYGILYFHYIELTLHLQRTKYSFDNIKEVTNLRGLSKNRFLIDRGVQDTYGILYFHYINSR
jgi:hypothetical protein